MARTGMPALMAGSGADDEVDVVVAKLRRISRDATLHFALSVGAIVIHHFYGGDPAAWRQKGQKGVSFRRLAQRRDLPFSPSLLYRCVAMFELSERLDAVSRWKHLNASHFRAVLGLPHEVQERLLTEANQSRWTVIQLELSVANTRRRDRQRVGRRPTPRFMKGVAALVRCLNANAEVLDDVSELALLESDQVESMCKDLHRVKLLVEKLESSVRAHAPALTEGKECGARSDE
jgi:hypothetical protein